jgi:signal peptidase I
MSIRTLLAEIAQTVVPPVVILVVLYLFVSQPFRVEQGSMEVTLEPGQYVMVDKLSPHLTGYHRGDIVVFHPPANWPVNSENTPFIKRVIGLPGETVSIGPDGVLINGVPLNEPYINVDGGVDVEEPMEWTLRSDELLVFGDHRSNSSDSRAYGPIPLHAVVGRAVLRYFPLDEISIIAAPSYEVTGP